MTTAARPTWAPAKGGNEQGGTRIFGPSQKYSSRDLASHTNLKPRSVSSWNESFTLNLTLDVWPSMIFKETLTLDSNSENDPCLSKLDSFYFMGNADILRCG